MASTLERQFETLWRVVGGPEYVTEYRFHPLRKWRLDVAWPDLLVGVELEGGTWMQGGHSRGKGFSEDCEKYNALVHLGWRVYRYTVDMLRDDPVGHLSPLLELVRLRTEAREWAPMLDLAAREIDRQSISDLYSLAVWERATRRSLPPLFATSDPEP